MYIYAYATGEGEYRAVKCFTEGTPSGRREDLCISTTVAATNTPFRLFPDLGAGGGELPV
jgi:hypothetical protein